ncbi:syntaxin protein [Ceratobasidium sp. AG-Ba]|nr:syntaxin protein [Ceratobasidium sp. AG-Ba]
MARDRLAAMRAERAQGGPAEHSYPIQTSERPYEMNSYSQPPAGYTSPPVNNYAQDNYPQDNSYGAPETEMTRFYDEITAIQDLIHSYRDNIKTISGLQSRSLTATDDEALRGYSRTRQRICSDPGTAIQEYQQAEQQYRQKSRQRMERQIRIVKPDATQEEIASVVNNDAGAQVFSQALMSSNRYGESRVAYREVQQRHDDVKKIEKTLTELAQLFSDMSVMVAQQDETIDAIETHAAQADKDMEQGLEQTGKAVEHARAARRKRWICFWISVVILAIIAIVLAVTLSKVIPNKNN